MINKHMTNKKFEEGIPLNSSLSHDEKISKIKEQAIVPSLSSRPRKNLKNDVPLGRDDSPEGLLAADSFPLICEENEEFEDFGICTSKNPEASKGVSEEGEGGKILFALSLIPQHPEETGVAAIAEVKEFDLTQTGAIQQALKENSAFAPVVWDNSTPTKSGFIEASAVVVDWDTPGHKDTIPNHLKREFNCHEFIKSLVPQNLPLPNIVYPTEHGFRLLWVLKRKISKSTEYENLSIRLASDTHADLQSASSAMIFRSKKHLMNNEVFFFNAKPLDVQNYLATTPIWSSDEEGGRYEEALNKSGLSYGSHSCSKCPRGGHDGADPNGIKVYANGVYCFSEHGLIPKNEIVRLAGLEVPNPMSLFALAQQELARFAAKIDVIDLLAYEIKRRLKRNERDAKILSKVLVEHVLVKFTTDPKYRQWRLRLEYFFNNQYPLKLEEHWADGHLQHRIYPNLLDENLNPIFLFEKCQSRCMPLGKNETALLKVITPGFNWVREEMVDRGKGKVRTLKISQLPDLSRFLNGAQRAIPISPLYEHRQYNRPTIGIEDGWKLRAGLLPIKVSVPKFVFSGTPSNFITNDFISDLSGTFVYGDPEMAGAYLGYLIQPMIAHIYPGQNPAYFFNGPTNSGKGFSGNIFPGLLYCSKFGLGVCESNFKSGNYEMDILMGKAVESPFLFIDEIIFASAQELKFIDKLVTQKMLEFRVPYVGYLNKLNHLTVGLSAINKSFSDETKNRLVEISIIESSNGKIKQFYEKWSSQLPELLKALYLSVSNVDLYRNIPSVPNRRSGFGLLQKILQEAFDLTVTYRVYHGGNDLLDLICRMHEDPVHNGTPSGSWTRYTPKTVANFYNQESRVPIKNEFIHGLLNTALGYQTTESHPSYKESGYLAENGKFYHIKITEEKQGRGESRRRFIYVRLVSETLIEQERKVAKTLEVSAKKVEIQTSETTLPDSRFPCVEIFEQ